MGGASSEAIVVATPVIWPSPLPDGSPPIKTLEVAGCTFILTRVFVNELPEGL